jgi:hypothetical protein
MTLREKKEVEMRKIREGKVAPKCVVILISREVRVKERGVAYPSRA